jgi:hypothetical protein
MDIQQTVQTRRYPLDIAQMQAIVRQVLADPAYADLWEPAYGGMISARAGTFATSLQVSWKQTEGGTDLTATILAPLTMRWGRADVFGIRQRALEHFFAALDQAVARA